MCYTQNLASSIHSRPINITFYHLSKNGSSKIVIGVYLVNEGLVSDSVTFRDELLRSMRSPLVMSNLNPIDFNGPFLCTTKS